MSLTWKEFEKWLKAQTAAWKTPNFSTPQLNQINTDSRKIKKADFFVPLKGESFDGHKFIADSLKKGAAGFLFETALVPSGLDLSKGIEVKNTLAALQAIAAGWLRDVKPKYIIGVTGSVGKTTTKEMLRSVLSGAGQTLVNEGSFNNEIGVPLTLLKLKPEHTFVALELAARHTGDIKFLTELVEPNICAILNASNVHLSEFGSLDAVYETKLEILRCSPSKAKLVAPYDDARLLKAAQELGRELTTFGKSKEASVSVKKLEWKPDKSMEVVLLANGKDITINFANAHESFAINAAATTAICLAANISPELIQKGLSSFQPVSGRFQTFNVNGLIIIDDSYNANPDSMAAGIRSCAKLYPKQKKIAVLGDMMELGKDSEKFHLAIGALCQTEMKPDLLITVGKESLKIAEGAIKSGLTKDKILSFAEVGEASRLPRRIFTKREVVFVKGSHGIGLENLVKTLSSKE